MPQLAVAVVYTVSYMQTMLASQCWYPRVSSTSKCHKNTLPSCGHLHETPALLPAVLSSVTDNLLAIWLQDAEPQSLLLAALAPCKQLVELRLLPFGVALEPLLQTEDRML